MVYTAELAEPVPRIDAVANCGHCGGGIVRNEVHGWLHLTGWHACRWPTSGTPREVMAAPASAVR